ncbi:MAG: arginine--tRNA ligase [Gammaproteobacteria bacterium]|nr:arginine--tRNA ligase [Gammaproteobacteria bacterium]
MKSSIKQLLSFSVQQLQKNGVLDHTALDAVSVERTRDSKHGDFATNLAMVLAKQARCNPRKLAEMLIENLPQSELVQKTEIAGPGFINFHVSIAAYLSLIDQVRSEDESYGRSKIGNGLKVMVEFVSANPTGPLHVGHGRGAAYGDAVARVLRAAGCETHSEYYINDAGRQMDILAVSIWLRYLEINGKQVQFPENGYQGDYIKDIATSMNAIHKQRFCVDEFALFEHLPDDKEERIDEIILRCKNTLGARGFRVLFDQGRDTLVEDIRVDLAEFGVVFQEWFSERSLLENGDIEKSISVLEENGHVFNKEGAKWFRATEFGDEKDRVVMRANGIHTYFASDMAYHYNKAERGFDKMLDIFGADHHGYVSRIMSSFEALGNDPEKLSILLVQFAVLYRGSEKVSMSTRGGDFVTLRELREEVGEDAARFFYALRKPDQHMDFDLDLAKSQSSDNPVYYIQYAHARICSVFRQLVEKGLETPEDGKPNYQLLKEVQEFELLQMVSKYPEVVELAARSYEPHQIAYYLKDLANTFHSYYNAHPFLSSENDIRLARLGLIDAVRIVFANGLQLLGVSAPQKM